MPEMNDDIFAGFDKPGGGLPPQEAKTSIPGQKGIPASVFDGFDSNPVAKFAGATGDPKKAGRSLELSKETGVNPIAINADQEGFEARRRAAEAKEILDTNTILSGMIGGMPLPEVIGKDLKNFDELINAGKALVTGDFGQETGLNSATVLHYLSAPIWVAVGSGQYAVDSAIKWYEDSTKGTWSDRLLATPKLVGREALAALGMAGAIVFPGTTIALEPVLDLLKTYAGFTDDQLLLLLLGLGHRGGIKGAQTVGHFRSLRDAMHDEEIAHLLKGDFPPPGSGPITDAMHKWIAEDNAAKMDNLVDKAVKNTEIKENAPELISQAVTKAGGEKSVWIDRDKIWKMYEDIVPGSEKDPLQLPDKVHETIKNWIDMQMSLGDFVAMVAKKPELYAELRDFIRLEENGVSVTNAKGLKPKPEDVFESAFGEKPKTVEEQAQKTWEKIKKSFYWQPLFADAKAAGMTEKQFGIHAERFMKLDEESFQKLAAKIAEAKRRELAPEWKAEKERITPQVEAEFKNADVINQGFNGNNPDPHLQAKINAEVQSRLEAKFGGSVIELALEHGYEAALSLRHAEFMTAEMNMLRERLGGKPVELSDIRANVKRRFLDKTVREVKPEIFRRGLETSAREAVAALNAGKYEEALIASQARLDNHLMMKEAIAWQKTSVKIEERLDRELRRDSTGPVDQEYLNHAREILTDVGYTDRTFFPPQQALQDMIAASDGRLTIAHWLKDGTKRPDYKDMTIEQRIDLDKSIKSLKHNGKWDQQIVTAHGEALTENAARDIAASLDRFPKIENINNSVKSWTGSLYRRVSGKALLIERIMGYSDKFDPGGAFAVNLDRQIRAAWNKELNLQEKVKRAIRPLAKYNTKLFDPIENNVIFDPATNGKFYNMNRRNLRQLMLYMGSDSGLDKAARGLFKYDQKLKGEDLESVVNINKQKLWGLVERNATKDDVAWVNGIHAAHESLWPMIEELEIKWTGVAPDKIEAVPRELMLADGSSAKMTGGYTRIKYDPNPLRSKLAKKLGAIDENSPFEGNYFRAVETPHSFTQPRTNYADFLDLSGKFFGANVREVIHDIAFREAIRDGWKLINHETFINGVGRTWGVERWQLFRDWIKDIANIRRTDETLAHGMEGIFVSLREQIVSSLIFLNPSTAAKHGVSAATMSLVAGGAKTLPAAARLVMDNSMLMAEKAAELARMKSKIPNIFRDEDFLQALQDVTSNLDRGKMNRDFIYNSSAMMRSRQLNYRDTVEGVYDRSLTPSSIRGLKDLRGASMDIGRALVAYSDSLSAMPLWLSEYKRNFGKFGDHDLSVYAADQAVTRAHGSRFIGDRPAFLRTDKELMRWITPLMAFWNHAFNNLIQIGWDAQALATRGARSEPGATVRSISARVVGLVMVPVIAEQLIEMNWVGHTEDEHFWAKEIFTATMRFGASFIPGINSIVNSLAFGKEPSVGIWSAFLDVLTKSYRDMVKLMSENDVSRDWIVHLAAMIGMTTGVGGPAPARTISGILGAASGEDIPEDMPQLIRQLKTGHPLPRGGH